MAGGASLEFYETYLHARYLADDSPFSNLAGQADDPIGAGLSFNVFQPGRSGTEQFPSEIEALAPGVSIFDYPNNRSGAVRYAGSFRTVYFAFGGYEAIAESNTRSEVMLRVINWLNGVNLEHTPLHDTEDTTAVRPVVAKVTSTVSPVASVALYWDTDGAPPFNRIEMIDNGDGNYSAGKPTTNRKPAAAVGSWMISRSAWAAPWRWRNAKRHCRHRPCLRCIKIIRIHSRAGLKA